MSDQRQRVRREVVSFVRRSTRMNDSQRKAWEAHRHTWVIDDLPIDETHTSLAPDAAIDPPAIFGREAPLAVEIGSGAGENAVALAAARPELNIIAFEVFLPAVASTLSRIARAEVTNVRIIPRDGAQGLATLFGSGEIAELWTFFPDPWHKGRHHKRRLVNPAFADLVADRLAPGGQWYLATDWAEYADHVHEVLDGHPEFIADHRRMPHRPLTKYESRGIEAGREIHDLAYRRRP
ncbi:tRNA (guanosine(46)-N7)-methyltransferase TrmB [Enemella sp. A6]|uniref:tRNA (guanosine(46)-N7)-methyltransferase TrmB n=1 Tax=Enemella sp. A6 TaxID=3440152 RepID=UPI003EB6C7F6